MASKTVALTAALIVALGALAAPVDAAANQSIPGFPRDWSSLLPAGDPPKGHIERADLSAVENVIEIIDITGLTDISVLSFKDMDVFFEPRTNDLLITMVPVTDGGPSPQNPIQETTIIKTTDLRMYTTPILTFFDGIDAQPNALNPDTPDFDPAYIFASSTPDVTVQHPKVLEDVEPTSISGVANMRAKKVDITGVLAGADFSVPVLTILDVDGFVFLKDEPVEDLAATVTTATTAAAIQALLDPISINAVDLDELLGSLDGASQKLGTVNLVGLASSLSAKGYTVQQTINASRPGHINVVPEDRLIDIVNPSDLQGKVALLASNEVKDVTESQITGLKNIEEPGVTRLFLQYANGGVPCACMLIAAVPPTKSGITDLAQKVDNAKLQMNKTLLNINVVSAKTLTTVWGLQGPDVDDQAIPDVDPSDVTLVGNLKDKQWVIRNIMADDPTEIDEKVLEMVGKPRPVDVCAVLGSCGMPGPPLGNHIEPFDPPLLHEDSIVNLAGGIGTPTAQAAQLESAIEDAKAVLGDFTFTTCYACIAPQDLEAFYSVFSQLEVFQPTQIVPIGTVAPPDVISAAFGPAGTVFGMVNTDELQTQLAEAYSTLRFRVITETARTPVADAGITVRTHLPGFQGATVQTFQLETNSFGYAAVKTLPNVAYNFTVSKAEILTASGSGATPGPGATEGRDVAVKPTGATFHAIADAATAPFALLVLGILLLAGYVVSRNPRLRRKLGIRRIGRRR